MGSTGKVGRRRGGWVLAAAGDGWALWVPVGQWDAMTEAERADLARRQAALLEGGQARASTRPPRQSAAIGS
jgi:hypothetical protein